MQFKARDKRNKMIDELKQAKANLERATKSGASTQQKWQDEVEVLELNIQLTKETEAGLEDVLIATQKALYGARAPRRAERERYLRELIGADPEPETGEIYVEVCWQDLRHVAMHIQVGLCQLDEHGNRVMERGEYVHGPLKGQPWEAVKKRFGFEVTVYGPTDNYFSGTKAAEVNMGSVGAQPVDVTEDLIRVHQMGLAVAKALNAMTPVWNAEDELD